ncbi:MAG: terpene cyclase/mutase family protein [Planctomycetota bacterium]|nr:terpene cyclase/mutase family protein [Planctomycetota bacterium]
MPSEPYLFRLGERLSQGLVGISPEQREKHQRFFLGRQNPDGGFRGRDTESDLYYTSFAVRGLALLGALRPPECAAIARYLASRTDMHVSVVDLVSWLYCALMVQLHGGVDVLAQAPADWPDRLASLLESFRTSDGGYAKTHDGAAGSTYHSFLVALCYELIGRQAPELERLQRFVFDRQRADGGFVEIGPMQRSGTNPTAAAVALLQMLGAVDDAVRDDVRGFLKDVRSGEGGFQANTRVPFADSLSTFTGLLTALDLGLTDTFDPAELRQFLSTLEFPDGGFRGATWDTVADVEYSFYALGVMGLVGRMKDEG